MRIIKYTRSYLYINCESEFRIELSHDSFLYLIDTKNENNQIYKKLFILIVNLNSELNYYIIYSCI